MKISIDGFLHGLAISIILGAILTAAALTTGCSGVKSPSFSTLSEIVLADIEAGDGPSQVASDVCKAFGGNSTTDAICADVTNVIENIITDLIVKGKLNGPGEARARAMLSALRPVGAHR